METNYIEKQIKRITRNYMILFLVGIIIVGTIMFLTMPNFSNLFGNSEKIDNYQQLKEASKNRKLYVKTKKTNIYYTGFQSYGGNDDTKYGYIIPIKNKDKNQLILYITDKEPISNEVEVVNINGKISKLKEFDKDLRSKYISFLTEQYQFTSNEANDYIISDIIIYDNNNQTLFQILLAAEVLVILSLISGLIFQGTRFFDYKNHKIYKQIEKTFNKEPEVIGDSLEREIKNNKFIVNKKSLKITDNYIILPGLYKFILRKKSDLVWAYYNETQHYRNGIPTGKTYTILLHLNNNSKDIYTITVGNKKKTLEVVETLAKNIDSAIYGYDKELKKLQLKNFPEFLSIVTEMITNKEKEKKKEIKEKDEVKLNSKPKKTKKVKKEKSDK